MHWFTLMRNGQSVIRKPMRFTISQIETIIAEAFDFAEARSAALHARLKHFQRLQFPPGINVGGGKRANYGPEQLLQVAFAISLIDLGFSPTRAIVATTMSWNEIRQGIVSHTTETGPALFAFSRPAALNALRDPILNSDTDAMVECATLEQYAVRGNNSTSQAADFTAVNLLGLFLSIVNAVQSSISYEAAQEFIRLIANRGRDNAGDPKA